MSCFESDNETDVDLLLERASADMDSEVESEALDCFDDVNEAEESGVTTHVLVGDKNKVRVSVPVCTISLCDNEALGVTRAGNVKVNVREGFGSVHDFEADFSPFVGSADTDPERVAEGSSVGISVLEGVGGRELVGLSDAEGRYESDSDEDSSFEIL